MEIFDLSQPMFVGMPQSSMHPKFHLSLQRRHGDLVRPDGGSGANELIITGGHVGTHIDAFAHISHDGRLHGGVDAAEAQRGGRIRRHGAETIAPLLCRGVLLDIPRAKGVARLIDDYEVTRADLEAALDAHRRDVARGRRDPDPDRMGAALWRPGRFRGAREGDARPGGRRARGWLADFRPRAIGSDTIPLERLPPAEAVPSLPVHSLLLVERGIHIIEILDLEEIAQKRVSVFTFFLSPLKIVGATGVPARPLAIRAKA